MNADQQARFDALYAQHLTALTLQGKAEATINAYARTIRMIAEFVDRCPADLTKQELTDYFAQRLDTRSWSAVKIDVSAVHFFYRWVLERDIPWIDLTKPPRIQSLPDVLTPNEVARIIRGTHQLRFQAFWLTAYSMGLRLSEVLFLTVDAIDAERRLVHVRQGKGRKDRFVVLPDLTLQTLRRLWKSHRDPIWLFPGRASAAGPADKPMDKGGTQKAFGRVVADVGIHKRVSIHSLRHSYATHLIEAGLNLASVQQQLGHADPSTTAKYVHMTDKTHHDERVLINRITDRLRRRWWRCEMAISLAQVVQAGRPALQAHYGGRLRPEHHRALNAITACRTGELGHTLMKCTQCPHTHVQLRSCGNRSCPQCQHHSAVQWLERQQQKLLPVDYFMVTFTLPAELRAVALSHPKTVYAAMFGAASATLQQFAGRHRLSVRLGMCAVLHTHSRRLDYHPHVHVIVPGGGVDASDAGRTVWRAFGRYLFNYRNLASVFRGKLLDALGTLVAPANLPKRWVVDCRRVGNGLPALKYLSRYLYRGVIGQRQIVALDAQAGTVTFRYFDGKTKQPRLRTLPIAKFLWRLMLHVLPRGFQRVRQFGFLHGNAKRLLIRVQWALRLKASPPPAVQPRMFPCPICEAPMQFVRFVAPPARVT